MGAKVTREAQDIARAKAMCRLNYAAKYTYERPEYLDEWVEQMWEMWLPFARVVREADAGLDLLSVPKTATSEMVDVFDYSYGGGFLEAMQPWERKKLVDAANRIGAV